MHQMLLFHIKNKGFLGVDDSQSENIGPQDVSRMSSSNVPRTSPKHSLFTISGSSRSDVQGTSQIEVPGTSLTNLPGTPSVTFKGHLKDILCRLLHVAKFIFLNPLLYLETYLESRQASKMDVMGHLFYAVKFLFLTQCYA